MDLDKLPDYLRERGFRVVGVPGWRKRRRPAYTGLWHPKGVLAHHTGGKPNGMTYARTVLAQGYKGLPGPLCQLAINRAGTVIFVSNGRANHAGKTRAIGFMRAGDGNTQSLGIEAMNTGTEGWDHPTPHGTYWDSYVRLCAAVEDFAEWERGSTLAHGETSTTGKWDPGHGRNRMIDMDKFRADVRAVRFSQDAAPTPVDPNEFARWFKVTLTNHKAVTSLLKQPVHYTRWLARRKKMFDEIARTNADVIASLESGAGAAFEHTLKAYKNRGYKKAHYVKGRTLWVREDADVLEVGHINPVRRTGSTSAWKPAPWIITEQDGTPALVCAGHLDPTQGEGMEDLRVAQANDIMDGVEAVAAARGLGKSQIVFMIDMASPVAVRKAFNARGYGDMMETAWKITNAEYKSFNGFKSNPWPKGDSVDGVFVRFDPKTPTGPDGNRPVSAASQWLTEYTDHNHITGILRRQG